VKVLHVNTFDNAGGAARAMHRLMKALQSEGVDAKMLVARQELDDPTVLGPKGTISKGIAVARHMVDQMPLRKYRKRDGYFSPAWLPDKVAQRIEAEAPDVVHLGWLAAGFMRIESMARIQRPTVYSLHDMWAFTGGCHVTGECERFMSGCGDCPILKSGRGKDLSSRVFNRKMAAWRDWKPVVAAPSRWIAETARKSPLFAEREIRIIPWCLNLKTFKPVSKPQARELLGLPMDRKVVLFGAMSATSDPNKGYDLLLEALGRMQSKDVTLAVFGASHDPNAGRLPFPTQFLGRLHDDVSLRLAYSAADVMAVPSRQESFGQSASEAMSCGTPVVAFGATGLLDVVGHQTSGYLAQPYDPADFAKGMDWVLAADARLSENARREAEERFAPANTTALYRTAFEDAIATYRAGTSRESS
jgi:glycosyltransferase involved in cell wall biosynthesis